MTIVKGQRPRQRLAEMPEKDCDPFMEDVDWTSRRQ